MSDNIPVFGVVAEADLRVEDRTWGFALRERDAIDRCWEKSVAANPGYFNGVIYLTRRLAIADGVLSAQMFPAEFKAFLYWRSLGYPDADAIDGFGSALITTADGAVILGRQRPGRINSGLTYLPGGFIDQRDVLADGRIDIAGSILRELREETGLGPADGAAAPGFLLARAAHQASFVLTFEARANADALTALIMARLTADPDSELQEVIAVRRLSDLEGSKLPPYADCLLRSVFASPRSVGRG